MPPHFLKAAIGLLFLLASCSEPPQQAGLNQDMAMGAFMLRAVRVDAYSRAENGVPWEVKVYFTVTGGNAFERSDFANAVTRKGRIVFKTSDGWSDRGWLLAIGDSREYFYIQVNPPLGSHGYTLTIGNPYGKPGTYLLDLGQ